jgi:hypothetical protein
VERLAYKPSTEVSDNIWTFYPEQPVILVWNCVDALRYLRLDRIHRSQSPMNIHFDGLMLWSSQSFDFFSYGTGSSVGKVWGRST